MFKSLELRAFLFIVQELAKKINYLILFLEI